MGFGSSKETKKQEKQENQPIISSENNVNSKDNNVKNNSIPSTNLKAEESLFSEKEIISKQPSNNEVQQKEKNSDQINISNKKSDIEYYNISEKFNSQPGQPNDKIEEKEVLNNIEDIEGSDFLLNSNNNFGRNKKGEDQEKKIIGNKDKEEISKKNNLNIKHIKTITDNEFEEIIALKEIYKERIGVLNANSLLIFSLKNFEKIDKIQIKKEELFSNIKKDETIFTDGGYDSKEQSKTFFYPLIDFIEIKNKYLILLSQIKIFIYNYENNKYKFFQIISEIDNITANNRSFCGDVGMGYTRYRDLYSLCELSNGCFLVCNVRGFNIYEKKDNKFILKKKTGNISMDVRYAIEINYNELVLLQEHITSGKGCTDFGYSSYKISIYNIETEEIKDLMKESEYNYFDSNQEKMKINYIILNEYLFVSYGGSISIYNIYNNMQLVKEYKNFGCSKIISNYFEDLMLINFFGHIKLYSFKNESLQYYCDFTEKDKSNNRESIIEDDIRGVIKLKNNNLAALFYEDMIIIKKYLC